MTAVELLRTLDDDSDVVLLFDSNPSVQYSDKAGKLLWKRCDIYLGAQVKSVRIKEPQTFVVCIMD